MYICIHMSLSLSLYIYIYIYIYIYSDFPHHGPCCRPCAQSPYQYAFETCDYYVV